MARKSVNFNLTEETNNRLRTFFPEGQALGTDDNMLQLLDAMEFYQGHKDDKPTSITDEALQKLRDELAKAKQDAEASNAQVIELDRKLQASIFENEQHTTTETTLKKEKEQLVAQLSSHEQTIAGLQSKQPTWNELRTMIQPFPVALLEVTAQRLSDKYKREITPMQILIDIFLRYTIERNAEWFYPFVLRDDDILSIAQSINPDIVNIKQIKQAIKR